MPQTKIPLEITTDGETRIPLTFDKRPELCIENRVEGLRDPMRPQMAIVVGREVLIRMGGDQGGRAVPVPDFLPRSRKRVSGVGYGGERRTQDVLLLPPDWKEHAAQPEGEALYQEMAGGEIPYQYTLSNGSVFTIRERLAKPVAVWMKREKGQTCYSSGMMTRFVDIRNGGWKLRTFFPSGCQRELSFKVAGREEKTIPLYWSSLDFKDLCKMLKENGLAHGRHLVLSVGGVPVFQGHVHMPSEEGGGTPEARLVQSILTLLDVLAETPVPEEPVSPESGPKLHAGMLNACFQEAVLRAYSPSPVTEKELKKTAAWKLVLERNRARAVEKQTFGFACILLIVQRNWERISPKREKWECPRFLKPKDKEKNEVDYHEFMTNACKEYLNAPHECLQALRRYMLHATPFIEKR